MRHATALTLACLFLWKLLDPRFQLGSLCDSVKAHGPHPLPSAPMMGYGLHADTQTDAVYPTVPVQSPWWPLPQVKILASAVWTGLMSSKASLPAVSERPARKGVAAPRDVM